MAFRVASKGTKRVVSKVTTSQNTKVKKVTLGKPVHAVAAGSGGAGGSLTGLSDATLTTPIENGSVLIYNSATSTWENSRTLDNQIIEGGLNGTIKIKRSTNTGNPSILANGELAYSYYSGTGGDKLYIGSGNEIAGNAVNHTPIGGKYYTDLLGGEVAPYGHLTANTALIADSNGWINRFNVGNFSLDSDTLVSSTGIIDVVGTRITNLGTPIDSSDATTKDYVDSKVNEQVSNNALTFTDGNGIIYQSSGEGNTVSFALDSSGVVAGTYGNQSQIPTITVDSTGRITDIITTDISTEIVVNGTSISLLDSGLDFTASSNLTSTFDSNTNTIDYALNTNVTGLESLSVDNILIDGNTIKTTDASNQLILDPAPTEDDGGTVIIRGDLVVQGTQTTINSTEVTINDLTLTVANGATTALEADGAGIIIGGADASITYDATNDRLTTNTGLNVNGPFSINGELIGEVIDDKVAGLLVGGNGLDLSYNDSDGVYSVSAELASISNTGVASFDSAQFAVDSSGHVSIHTISGADTLIKFKTYDVTGELPTEQELEFGEIAINTVDGKLFVKKEINATASIIEIGGGIGGGGSFDTYEYIATQGQTVFSGADAHGDTLQYDTSGAKFLVWLNGILLTNSVDYTATDGTSVVFSIGLDAGHAVQIAAYSAAIVDVPNDIALDDNVKLILGTGYDAYLYHDGSNTVINQRSQGTGDLKLQHSDSDVMSITATGPVTHKELVVKDYVVDTNYSMTSGSVAPFVIDTVPLTAMRSARYTVQISNISAGTYQSSEILLIHDTTSVYFTQFGEIHTGVVAEGTLSASIVGSNIILSVTPSTTNSYEFKTVRHSVFV